MMFESFRSHITISVSEGAAVHRTLWPGSLCRDRSDVIGGKDKMLDFGIHDVIMSIFPQTFCLIYFAKLSSNMIGCLLFSEVWESLQPTCRRVSWWTKFPIRKTQKIRVAMCFSGGVCLPCLLGVSVVPLCGFPSLMGIINKKTGAHPMRRLLPLGIHIPSLFKKN